MDKPVPWIVLLIGVALFDGAISDYREKKYRGALVFCGLAVICFVVAVISAEVANPLSLIELLRVPPLLPYALVALLISIIVGLVWSYRREAQTLVAYLRPVSWYLAVTAGLWLLLFTLQAIIPFAPRTTPSNTTNIGGLQYSSPLPGEGPETTIQQREFQTAEALFKRLQKYNGDVAAIPGMPGSGQYQAGLDWTKDELLGDYHYNFLPTILAIRQDAIRAGDKAWHDTDFYEQGQMDIGRIRIVAADLASRAVQ